MLNFVNTIEVFEENLWRGKKHHHKWSSDRFLLYSAWCVSGNRAHIESGLHLFGAVRYVNDVITTIYLLASWLVLLVALVSNYPQSFPASIHQKFQKSSS